MSLWNGTAAILFFAGIFLGFRLANYSAVAVGFFMWIVGGAVANMLFGKSTKHKKKTSVIGPKMEANPVPSKETFCSSCGEKNSSESDFCIECGANLQFKESTTTTGKPVK